MAATQTARQMTTVQNLELVPCGHRGVAHYVLIEYRVEEWAGNHVCVTRAYKPVNGASSAAWHECFCVGPRGGIKIIYRNFY